MTTLQQQIRNLTNDTGVYLFRKGDGTIIYVGKAIDLRRRVSSYLNDSSLKSRRIRSQAEQVEVYVTGTEAEALILENNLIKKHRPRYNILLKDDKTYPYIELTMGDAYPGVYFSRRTSNETSRYFGPYPSAGAVRRIISLTEKFFRLRTCRADFDKRTRPCLKYQIHRCTAPCVGYVDGETYSRQVRQAEMFLDGRYDKLEVQVKEDMERLAEKLEFERAAELRDLLREIEKFRSKRVVLMDAAAPLDAVAVTESGEESVFCILHFRNGRLLDKSEYRFPTGEGLLQQFLEQYLHRLKGPLKWLVVNRMPADPDLLTGYHQYRFDQKLNLRCPQRGRFLRVIRLAEENVMQQVRQDEARIRELKLLKDRLKLQRVPRVCECMDISHLGGTAMVGSVVRFTDGKADKDHYRRFRIRHGQGNDDVRSIREVVSRRYGRLKREGRPMPDLIIIDGGKGQLRAVKEELQELGLAGQADLVSLAKREETVFSGEFPEGLELDFHEPAVRLMARIRDEAHRFALTYNRKLRQKAGREPALTDVPGIGETKAKRLLRAFGSLKAVLAVNDEQLKEYISEKDVAAIRTHMPDGSILETDDDPVES